MNRIAGLSLTVLLSACGGGGGGDNNPTGPGAPPPTATTFSLSGRINETAPSSFRAVEGATLTIADGANGGRSVTTNSEGRYQFTGLQQGGFTLTATANGYEPSSAGINLTGNMTRDFSLNPTGPRTAFGPGQHRVGSAIAAGRYFSDPDSSCYWERQSGFGGTFNEIIANDFLGYNALQYIVDILPSDAAFDTDSDCGNWYNTPRHPAQSGIPPGVWLVGSQVAPGTYEANATSGCYWERLRHFTHRGVDGVIANDFVSGGGTRIVTISANDAGFLTDGDCGTWSRSFAFETNLKSGNSSPADIQRNRDSYRAKNASAGR